MQMAGDTSGVSGWRGDRWGFCEWWIDGESDGVDVGAGSEIEV